MAQRRPNATAEDLPQLAEVLAELHARTKSGESIEVRLLDDSADPRQARDVAIGGGFVVHRLRRAQGGLLLVLDRAHSLADSIRPDLRLLVCGLNPSPYAAETGIPFGRPGNRFWPAAQRAGVIENERDVHDALARGVGFTDLVKRTTAASAELVPEEYRDGLRRLTSSLAIFQPRAVCFVGLEGIRKATGKKHEAGWMEERIGRVPAYLMPSTSGRNAHATPAGLADHLRRAAAADLR